ncbi:sulfite exporter TauE/SafE family protein [Methanoculleus sp. FWC-SCC3]|uniref:Probable membrane transporter protein n=1 Tax=Methanoculleus methanifontis TaxID=2584086 RepID=A0ABT8LYB3_9EURY|nr:sulfite exporter TauE/SafE family protein [Methanoculleus sp. FWC-SCC3]MDN7011775.1 sulfite exporter TauE/SafE family protein [Methanoculleus sp. FWC-SCC3]
MTERVTESVDIASVLKKHAPTIVLLAVIVGLTVWSFSTGMAAKEGAPAITLTAVILLIVVGLAAGMLGGIIGTGGCSVMLPILHFYLGYPVPIAIGTTLFAVIFTAMSGGYGHLIRKNLDVKTTLWLGGFGIIGVIAGSYAFNLLSDQTALLGLILGIAFLLPAVRMILEGVAHRKKSQPEGNVIPGSEGRKGLFGFVVGILTGLVGLGGGYALVPGLIYLFNAPVYVTMGTSLATMIPLAVVGGGIKLAEGYVAIGAALILAAGTIVGAQLGAAVIKKFHPATLKLIFGVYFLYVSVKFILAYFGVAIF